MKSNLLFTLGILISSALAYSNPQYVISLGHFETKALILPLLMLIMFGMGTHLSLKDFVAIWRNPKSLAVGLVAQFVMMPMIGFVLVSLSDFPAEIAAGVLLVGCSPSGLASNVMCFISKANLALSVSLTTSATLLAPLLTPFLMTFLASEYVAIDPIAMFVTMLKLIVLPVVAGMVINHLVPKRWHFVFAITPVLSMLGIIVIVAIIVALGQEALQNVGVGLIAIVIMHNTAGFMTGYLAGRLGNLDEASCRALAFEVGMQNSGLASGIALTMNKVATMGLAAALFSSIQNITGSLIASYWGAKTKPSTS